jgi:hypothetical protein
MDGDQYRPETVGNQVLTSSHRKAAAVIIFMEKPCGIYAARLSQTDWARTQRGRL